MPLFQSEVYDALREIGISHEKAAAAAVALYASRPTSPSLPPWPQPAWFWLVVVVMLAAILFLSGYVMCAQGHVAEQTARTRALIERLQPLPQP